MMEALAPGGQCAVVVPEGLLFGSTSAHVELRRKLVEDFDLLAMVSLPGQKHARDASARGSTTAFGHAIARGTTAPGVATKHHQ